MGAEDSVKKLKRKNHVLKKREEDLQTDENSIKAKEEHKQKKPQMKMKKSSVDTDDKVKADEAHKLSGGSKKSKKLKRGIRKSGIINTTGTEESDAPQSNRDEERVSGEKDVQTEQAGHKSQKSRKKRRKNTESDNAAVDASEQQNVGKSKKSGKTKNKSELVTMEPTQDNLLEKKGEDAEDEVYVMSSGDEDCSKGMKKWMSEYHESRPGIKVLQERIDDFITAHEAKQEQARAEREAKAAEGGWTVVVHHKGRKKTTDAESGVAVGSVAEAAVLDKMGKKKKNEVGLDFYRFQKREAQRNEIMMLQTKFEQDKKRIQEMRAARKFRPY